MPKFAAAESRLNFYITMKKGILFLLILLAFMQGWAQSIKQGAQSKPHPQDTVKLQTKSGVLRVWKTWKIGDVIWYEKRMIANGKVFVVKRKFSE